MAITYVNDLRLSEMGTGDNSGTWGTVTNTNLELIGEAFGFGTEAITTNADTHTSTIADGSTDPVRAMYVKYTGTLDSTCTITIGPNTVNKFYYIENGTSGSQDIVISQGSGANVTIPAGDVKAVYLDGAGSGAAVTDAFASLNVGALTATTADNTAQLTLISTDADANAGPKLKLRRNSASPANDDLIGAIDWTGENSDGDEHDFLNLTARMRDVTAGSEDVAYAWSAYLNGTAREIQSFVNTDASAASMVFNEDSQDIDFRVESNNHDNLFFIDGGNDGIGIGNSTIIDWSTNYPGLQMGQAGALYGHKSSNQMNFAMNWGVTTGNVYIADGIASRMVMDTSKISFDTSASGSAGGSITGINTLQMTSSGSVFNEDSADLDFRVESNGNANMLFVDGGNDAVVVGHSTGIAISGEHNELQVYDTNFSVASFATFRNGSDGATLSLAHSRSGTIGTQTVLNDGDIMGGINFIGSDGTDMASVGAAIRGSVDGTPGSNDMPGRLTFLTTADDAASPTERMRIDSRGTVAIGTTDIHAWDGAFDGRLRIGDRGFFGTTSASTQMGYNWYWDGSAYKRIDTDFANRYYQNGGEHVWDTAVSGSGDTSITWVERMKITNGGVVELGEVREQTNGADLSVTMVSEDAGFSLACRSATDGHTPYITFQKTPATSGNYTATGVDDFIGLINFKGVNTSAVANEAARIQVVQSATSSSSVPAIMKFEVGAISNCLQIAPNSSAGAAVSIGTTAVARRCDIRSTSVTTLDVCYQYLSEVSMIEMSHARATGGNNGTYIQLQNAAGVEKGTIKLTATATSYNTSSDYRLKENVSYDWDGTTRLKQLKPARFNWIEDDTNTLVDGFLAHEAAEAVPEAVSNNKDEMKTVTNAVLNSHGNVIDEGVLEADWIAGKIAKTDDNGKAIEPAYESDTSWVASKEVPVYQQIDHSKLVPLLVKTIQELEARITALEA